MDYNKILTNIQNRLIRVYSNLPNTDKQDFNQEVLLKMLEAEHQYNYKLGDKETFLFFRGYYGAIHWLEEFYDKDAQLYDFVYVPYEDDTDTEIFHEQLRTALLQDVTDPVLLKLLTGYFFQEKTLRELSKELGMNLTAVFTKLTAHCNDVARRISCVK